MSSFISELNNGFSPDPKENVFSSVWNEYERVIIKSLVTSFGLDFLVHDQHGGDVDTIHNVREIGKDANMKYKNIQNQMNYENRGAYDKAAYHSDSRYKQIVKNAKKNFDENGTKIDDAYVPNNKIIPRSNNTIPREKQAQLDHVLSAEYIHNDPGRILADLNGVDLANSESNLRFTNASLNLNMSNMTIDEYLNWCKENPDKVNWNGKKGEPIPPEVEKRLRKEYARAKKEYDKKIEKAYYTSPKFLKDTAIASGSLGVEMGMRQAMGFVFVEIWISSKEEIQALPPGKDLKDMFEAVANGIKKGVENAKIKYKEILAKFGEGFVSGALASLTTTICNIFFTTAKNLVRCIRQIYASVVEAGNILLFNPDNLIFGDRIKTATIVLATGASVLVGTTVGTLIQSTPIAGIPVVGSIVTAFCSSLVSGLISCTLLIFLDRSKFMNNIINALNRIPSEVNNYKEIADALEILAAKLEKLDIAKFRSETEKYRNISIKIGLAESEQELNDLLHSAYKEFNIKIPWEGDFDTFMGNKSNHLVFE
ncbi:MAG: hypothetical protein K5983_01255 [Lactobacillus sp.]|nr:hypothetical protein [Lactobacillus sp.]